MILNHTFINIIIQLGIKLTLIACKILERASYDLKLQLKEMLLKKEYNQSLKRQMNSGLFTLINRNSQQDSHITREIEKNLNRYIIKDKKNHLYICFLKEDDTVEN